MAVREARGLEKRAHNVRNMFTIVRYQRTLVATKLDDFAVISSSTFHPLRGNQKVRYALK